MRKEIIFKTFLATFSYPFPIIAGYLIDMYSSLPKLSFPFNYFFGPILISLGSMIIFVATDNLIRFGDGTPNPSHPPRSFVKNGLYRYVRHPIYLGWIILLLGGIIYFDSLSILEATAIILLFLYLYIVDEEKNLEKTFGKKYADYKKKVPMIIPKFW